MQNVWFIAQHYLWLIPVALAVGSFGTLVGAGGGFILVPLLLLVYPEESPSLVASISLAVVFFNALSGSIAYARLKRIDYRSGIIFSGATIPGAVLGAYSTGYIPRLLFEQIFGVLMIAGAIFLFCRRERKSGADFDEPPPMPVRVSDVHLRGDFRDNSGTSYSLSYNPIKGAILSLLIGYLSSLLGVGGGFMYVPALVHLLNFPVPIATATSQFILAVMALAGTLVHVAAGVFVHGVRRTLVLVVGVILGAQFGAWISTRVGEGWIIRGLAIALGLVGSRLLSMSF